jgi:hypothetical protein
MLVHRTARRLHHKDISPAHILLNLDVHLAVAETRHQGLPARHAEKIANLIGQRLVRRAAKNLELLVHPRARLALRFFEARVERFRFLLFSPA